METFAYIIKDEDVNKRVDIYLSEQLKDTTRSYIQKLIKGGSLIINDEVKDSKNYKLRLDDELLLELPEPVELDIKAEDIPLDIVYEDQDIVIVNKPQGMVVHPAPGNYEGTLVNALMYHIKDLSAINGVKRPGIVHRIDKDTSGLLMVAKNDQAHKHLADLLKDHDISRVYWALVHGNLPMEEGFIDKPIGRNPNNRLKMCVTENNSKEAKTHYRVLRRFDNRKYTLVELTLETGRTHQIRVHMSYIGHPLVGDPVYGPKKEKIKHEGQLLHAKLLGFIHPRTGEYVEFESELPEYFEKMIKKAESV